MLEKLRSYLKPPVFPGDEDKTFTADLLHVILWVLLVADVFYTLIVIALPQARLIIWLYAAVLAGLTLSSMFLSRRGNVRLGAITINIGLWILLTIAAYSAGGVIAPAYSGYLIVILCVSLLVGWQWGAVAAAASALAGAFFLLAAHYDWLPEWQSRYNPAVVWSASTVYFFVASLLLALALRTINRASQQTRREMSERLKAEDALRQSEQRFHAIFDSVNDAIFVQDLRDGSILDVNKTMCEMYGYTVEEARHLSVGDLSANYPPFTQQDATGWWQKATHGEPQIFQWLAKDRAGRLFWVEVNMRPAAIDGQDRLLVVVRDIDARKRAEETLQREKQFAEDIINSLPGIFCMTNQQGELVRWNRLCELVAGYSAAELSGKSIQDLFVGEHQQLVAAHVARVMEEGAADVEVELVTKDGQQLPYYLVGVRTVLDDQAYLVGFGIDLSVRRRAEREARQREAYLRSILDNFPYLVWLKDAAGRFLAVNEVFAKTCHQPNAEAVVGKTDLDVWPRELAERYRADDQSVIDMRAQKSVEEIVAAQGVERWFETYKSPIFDAQGNVIGTTGFAHDITDRRQAAEREQRVSQGLRTVIEAAQELIDCADLDTLYRRSVELAREKLGLERCGLFLLDERQQFIQGTFGTDDQGQTTDEHRARHSAQERPEVFSLSDQLWFAFESVPSYWNVDHVQWLEGKGWNVATPIRSRRRTVGVLYNDTAITRAPLDETQQDMAAMYCSLLGSLLELKRAEADLVTERDLLQLLMDNFPDTIYFKDSASRFTRINRAQARLLGVVSPEEAIGKTDADFFQSSDLNQMFLAEEQHLMTSGEPIIDRVEYNPAPGGGPRWLSASKVPLRDGAGQIVGMVGISRDVTDRILAQQRDQTISHGLRAVIETVDELMSCADMDTLYRRAVELAREKLKVERCGLFVLDEQGWLCGTYGTDLQGQTSDERGAHFQPVVGEWLNAASSSWWAITESEHAYWEGDRQQVVGAGWVGTTAIRPRDRLLGVLYNDTALTRAPVDEAQQEVLAVYCSLLGSLLELKRAEAALLQREAYLSSIFDNFPYWVWLKDAAGRFLAVNQTMAQAFGFEQARVMIGKTDRDITSPELAEKYRADDLAVMESRTQRLTEEIVIDHGAERWSETFKSPIFDAQGQIIGTTGFAHDITARRQAEAAIRESEALFRQLADNAPAFIALSDETGMTTYLNRAWQEFRGHEQALPLEEWAERIHPDDRRRYTHEFRSSLQGQRKFTIEYRLRRADGQYRWLLDTVVPRYAADERLAGFIGIAIDITDRKNAEEALRRSEGRLRLITDNMADSISQVDAQQRLVYASPSAERVYGHSLRDLLGRPLYDFVHPEEGSRLYHQVVMAIELHVPSLRLEYRYRHAAGHYLWVESEMRLLYDERGDFTGAVFGSRDISARKQIEVERENLIRELEDKNAELERFSYTVSHDLKSPLITIRGFLGFLEKDAASGNLDRLRADIARIAEATTRMQRLLDELLELSRIGRMSNPPEEVPFGLIAREAVELVYGRITTRGVQVEIADDLPPVSGDRVRLVEAVQNLVDNAVKFMGDQPEPRIKIGVLGTERAGMPIFFVEDNGVGIEPEYHERVFGLFNKLDAKSEGTGVGLALVKRIIDLHGGYIWLESDGAGHGSTFFFTLPRPASTSRNS